MGIKFLEDGGYIWSVRNGRYSDEELRGLARLFMICGKYFQMARDYQIEKERKLEIKWRWDHEAMKLRCPHHANVQYREINTGVTTEELELDPLNRRVPETARENEIDMDNIHQ